MNTLSYLGFVLEGAGRLYVRHFERRARDLALEPMDCKALLVLADNEGITQQRLAEMTLLNPAYVGRLLDRLEVRGLIARRVRPGDRRARSVALTPRAANMLPSLWEVLQESLRKTLSGMSAAERRCLMGALQRVVSNLSAPVVDCQIPTVLGTSSKEDHDGQTGAERVWKARDR